MRSARRGFGRRFFGSALVLLTLVALASCSVAREKAEVSMRCDVEPTPPRVGDVIVECEIAHVDGEEVRGADVEIEMNMTHPGMQPVVAKMTEVAAGRYRSELRLTMAGDWYLRVYGSLADGRRFEEVEPLPGVLPTQ